MEHSTRPVDPEPSRRGISSVYNHFFRSRPAARKIKKRSSVPEADKDLDPELTSAPAPTLVPGVRPAPTSAHQFSSQATAASKHSKDVFTYKAKSNNTAITITPTAYGHNRSHSHHHNSHNHARNAVSQPNSSTGQHQRSRSANAIIYRPKYDDNLLKPIPPRTPGGSTRIPLSGSRIPVDRPGSRPDPNVWHNLFPGANFVAGMNRPTYDKTGPSSTQHAQRSNKMPSAMRGNYAQIDPQPTVYQRRASATPSTTSSVGSYDTFDAILASPASSRTSFDSWQSISRKPDHGWQRPSPIKQYRRRREPGELFAALPEEVLGLILQKLGESHLKSGSVSCATCMMRDLCSVAVSAKKLLMVARVALYGDIQLVGADSQAQKKRLKLNFGSRLVLLRRTLRSNPGIAILVRSLKAPAVPQGIHVDLYQNLIASVIMACPNFEKLVGPHQNYDFTFRRLFHALSTREQLREVHWTLEAPKMERKRGMSNAAPISNASNPNFQEAPRDLRPDQSYEFRDLHMNWANLTTLSIHCLPGATLTPLSLLPDILSDLPSLQHLHLSHLPHTAFNDTNLVSLPALQTLTLSHLPGVSSEGLSTFARRPSSRSIRKLTLHHLDIDSLPAIAQVISHLRSLETFVLAQTLTPILAEGEMIWLFPYLASSTVKKLHWDIPSFASTANIADSILAKSIVSNGFPALRTLRTPADPEGIFQDLCKPLNKIEQDGDRYRGLINKAGTSRPKSPPTTPTTPRTPRTPGSEVTKSPFGLNFPMDDQLFPSKVSSNLVSSRLGAQRRLEGASDEPRFTFNLVDERGQIVESKKMAGFLGTIGSPIDYCLTPDEGAMDENGGLVEISDLLGDGGENLKDGNREGCTGRWNTYSGVVVDKKDRERWWHTERGRWKSTEL